MMIINGNLFFIEYCFYFRVDECLLVKFFIDDFWNLEIIGI